MFKIFSTAFFLFITLSLFAQNPPTDISIDNSVIDEEGAFSKDVGYLSTTDLDNPGDIHTYSILPGPWSDNFSIVSGNLLRTYDRLSYEDSPTVTVDIRTTDSDGNTYDKELTITLNDIPEAPTSIITSNNRVLENSAGGTIIALLDAKDEDYTGNYFYSLNGSTTYDNELFEISGNQLKVKAGAEIDYQDHYNSSAGYSTITAYIRVVESGSDDLSRTRTIFIDELNSAPTGVYVYPSFISENQPVGTLIDNLSLVDLDGSTGASYKIIGGADKDAFFIEDGKKLKSNRIFNYEEQNSYEIIIRGTDLTGQYFDDTETISIINENDAPNDITLSPNSINEGLSSGTIVGTLSAMDEDASGTYVYEVTGGPSGSLFTTSGSNLVTAAVMDFEKQSQHEVLVKVTNGIHTFEKLVSVTINDQSGSPEGVKITNNKVIENQPIGTLIGTVYFDDSEDGPGWLYVGLPGQSDFELIGNELYTKSTNYDDNPTKLVSVMKNATTLGTLTIDILPENISPSGSAPLDITLTSSSISENNNIGDVIGYIAAADFDFGDSFSYAILSNEYDLFEIGGINNDELIAKGIFDYEESTSFDLTLQVIDSEGLTYTKDFTIYIEDELEGVDPPGTLIISNSTVAENSPQGSLVGTLSMTPGVPAVSMYNLVGPESTYFQISGNQLQTSSSALDFEEKSKYQLGIEVFFVDGSISIGLIEITVTNTDEVPLEITITDNTVHEEQNSPFLVGYLSASDDDGDTHTFSITGGPDQALFTISGDELLTNAVLDYSASNSHEIIIEATDDGGNTLSQPLTIDVREVRSGPVDLTLSNYTIHEGDTDGTMVGVLTPLGLPTGESIVSYAKIGGGDSGNDAFCFYIDDDRLMLGSSCEIDYETDTEYSITIRAVTDKGNYIEKSFSITVLDLINESAEAPSMLALDINSVDENESIGTTIGTLSASDDNDPSLLVYEIIDGDPENKFFINTDQLLTNVVFDYEAEDTYTLTIRAIDQDGLSTDDDFIITINDLNESPWNIYNSFTSSTGGHFQGFENVSNAEMGFIEVSDDFGDNHSFTLGGTDAGTFLIQYQFGNYYLKSVNPLDYESQSTYEITITAEDQNGNSFTQAKTVYVLDKNDPPVDISISNDSFLEGNDPDVYVGSLSTLSLEDEEHTYSIQSGEDGAMFYLNDYRLYIGQEVNYETNPELIVTIRSTDEEGYFFDENLTINIGNINEAPTASNSTFSVAENSSDGASVGTVSASDPDGDDVTYSITSGNTNSVFTIEGSTGAITVATGSELDYETTTSYTLTVNASDGTLSDEATITVNVTDVNEAPSASDATLSVAENSSDGTAVGTVSASDSDGDDVTYSITSGNTDNVFAINSETGAITVATGSELDYETTTSYTLTVTVSDGTLSDEATITVNVTDVNEAPSANDATFSVAENSSDGTAVGTVSASDPDGDDVTYSITSGNTDNVFAINSETGAITVAMGSELDYETTTSYTLTVTVSDGTLSDEATITVNVTDVNEAPSANDATLSVAENSSNGTAVGAASASDPDGDDVTYSITSGNTDNVFAINSETGAITVAMGSELDYETTTSYTLTVNASDGTLSDEATITVNVTDVNEAPSANDATFNVAENSSDGTAVGTVSASDPDGDDVTYSITSGNTDNVFAINSGTGAITVATGSELDYGTTTSYTLTVTVSDGTLSDEATITINVTNVNEAPSANDATFSVAENSSDGASVGTVSASDPDGDEVMYSITSGNTNSVFTIEGSTGAITVATGSELDYETTTSYTLTVNASDGTLSDEATITVNVTDVNEAPSASDATLSVAENSSDGTAVGTVSASDSDGDDVTYSITSGNTDNVFAINSETGAITVATGSELDYETTTSYTLTVTVSDGTLSDEATITVNVTDVNEAPSANDATFSVAENSSDGTAVGTVSASDPDGDDVTYSITSGNTDNVFAINSETGAITVAMGSELDYETTTSYTLTVTVSDGTLSDEATITVNVTDVNEAPSANDATLSVAENSSNGTAVGAASASDPDGDDVTYSITSGNTDNVFAINSETGAITVAMGSELDYETTTSYTLTVNASDGTLSDEATITVNVTDVNEAPSANDATFNVAENSSDGTAVGTVSASDPDGDDVTYSITSGNTDNVFAINSGTGAITVATGSELDYGTTTSYTLTVTVSDGTLSDEATITINVTNVNEAPSANDATFSVAENSSDGASVGTVSASDPDGDEVMYSITSGNTNSVFTIEGSTGAITVATGSELDYETTTSYTLTVNASDGTLSDEATITINVTDVNEAPSASDATLSVAENSSDGTAVGTVSASDSDGDDVTYSITSGNTDNVFAINSETGAITVATGSELDYETTTSYTLTVTVSDGTLSDEATITVNVTDVNEAPSANDATLSVAENSPNGITVGTISASDPDSDDLTYSITAGNSSGAFGINASTGLISVADGTQLDYETTTSYTLTVNVSDGTLSVEATITVNVTDINEDVPNEVPTHISLTNNSVDENQVSGTAVGVLNTTDPDEGDTHTYSLVSGDVTWFSVDGNVLKTAAIFDYEIENSYTLRIRTTDQGGLVYEDDFTITVNDLEETENVTPTDLTLSNNSVNENDEAGTRVGTLNTIDANIGDIHTYSISGMGASAFSIDGDELKTTMSFDYETASSYAIIVATTDQGGLTYEENLTITVRDLNEVPTDISLDNSTVNENMSEGTLVGLLTTVDEDINDEHNYTLSGTDANDFSIVGNELRTNSVIDPTVKSSYSLTITSTDLGGFSFSKIFTISVEGDALSVSNIVSHVKVFPNPAKNYLNIGLEDVSHEVIAIEIFDAFGKNVFKVGDRKSLNRNELRVDISSINDTNLLFVQITTISGDRTIKRILLK